MTLQARIDLLTQLGDYLQSEDEYLQALMHRTEYNNRWLTVASYKKAIKAISNNYLQKEALVNWGKAYAIKQENTPKRVGIVIGDGIPLVGLHDVVAVFLSGNHAVIKLAETDKFVLPHLLKKMGEWDAAAKASFEISERLHNFDAIIADKNMGTSTYFERYFGKYPHILRNRRRGIAVLDGQETMADLYALGNDIFEYFGLGNRSVSKIYVPKGYKFDQLLEALHAYNNIVLNTKYKNNFDYNYAMYLLNKMPYKANGCVILVENEAITSRIASLHYEFYDKPDTLVVEINRRIEEIQCVVSKMKLAGIPTIPFGKSQQPKLTDYVDGADTMQFLTSL